MAGGNRREKVEERGRRERQTCFLRFSESGESENLRKGKIGEGLASQVCVFGLSGLRGGSLPGKERKFLYPETIHLLLREEK